jgi:uncharacterized protein (TIGR00369 family)
MKPPVDLPAMLTAMIPFIDTVGIRIDSAARGAATATLPARHEVNNHMGTAHAGAVYTLGESASGGVVLSLFGDLLPNLFVALKSATVEHHKAAPGDVVATASLTGSGREIRAGYEASGKADFDVVVEMAVGELPVATMTYTWAIRAPR